MAKVILREGETVDSMLTRFKREVKNSGVLEDLKKKEFFMSASFKRKEKDKAALQRKLSKKGK